MIIVDYIPDSENAFSLTVAEAIPSVGRTRSQ